MRVAASASVTGSSARRLSSATADDALPGVAERALVMLPSRLSQQLESGRRIRSRRFPHDRQLRVRPRGANRTFEWSDEWFQGVADAFGFLRSPHEHSSLSRRPVFRLANLVPTVGFVPSGWFVPSAGCLVQLQSYPCWPWRSPMVGPDRFSYPFQRRLGTSSPSFLCAATPHAAGRGRGPGGVLLSVRVSAGSCRSRCHRFGCTHSGQL